MAITGRFGSVQRLLPYKTTADGKSVYRWDGYQYDDTGTPEQGGNPAIPPTYEWNGDILVPTSSFRWSVKAQPRPDGLQPNSPGVTYSNTVSAVQSWSLENNVATQTYTASNLMGYNAKYGGVKSCTGSFQGIGAFPPLLPGNRFLFRGFVGPENGQALNGNKDDNCDGYVYQVAAIVTNIQIQINYGNFAPVTWTVQWQSDYKSYGDQLLVFGLPAEHLGFFDYTAPPCNEASASKTCKMYIGNTRDMAVNSPEMMDNVCMESANIAFNTQTQQTANSCSAKAGGWQTSVVGATDVTIDATIHGSHYDVFNPVSTLSDADQKKIAVRSQNFYPGVDRYVRIFIGDTKKKTTNETTQQMSYRLGAWEFNKLFVGSFTGLNVDIAGGGIVSFRTQMEFNGFPKKNNITVSDPDNPQDPSHNTYPADESCEKGYIKYRLPDETRDTDTGWESFLNLDQTYSVPWTVGTTAN